MSYIDKKKFTWELYFRIINGTATRTDENQFYKDSESLAGIVLSHMKKFNTLNIYIRSIVDETRDEHKQRQPIQMNASLYSYLYGCYRWKVINILENEKEDPIDPFNINLYRSCISYHDSKDVEKYEQCILNEELQSTTSDYIKELGIVYLKMIFLNYKENLIYFAKNIKLNKGGCLTRKNIENFILYVFYFKFSAKEIALVIGITETNIKRKKGIFKKRLFNVLETEYEKEFFTRTRTQTIKLFELLKMEREYLG